jgi:hypothetical protein
MAVTPTYPFSSEGMLSVPGFQAAPLPNLLDNTPQPFHVDAALA